MLCGSLDGRGVWRKWIHLHVWICPFPVHLKPLQHCLLISYTPTQYKKFFKMFKKNTAKNESHYSGPLVSVGKWFQDPDRYQISPCSSPWHKTNKFKKKKKRHSTVSLLSADVEPVRPYPLSWTATSIDRQVYFGSIFVLGQLRNHLFILENYKHNHCFDSFYYLNGFKI